MVDKKKIEKVVMDFMGRDNMKGLTGVVAVLIVQLMETISGLEEKAYLQGYSDGKRNREKQSH